MIEVMSPVLDEIGIMYVEVGEFSLSQGYVASKVAEETLTKMLSRPSDTAMALQAEARLLSETLKRREK